MRKIKTKILATALAVVLAIPAGMTYAETRSDSLRPDYQWTFESVSGKTVANEGTAASGDATLNGTAAIIQEDVQDDEGTYLGDGNHVLSLAGGNKGSSYVTLPNDLYKEVSSETGFTYSFWIKPDKAYASYARVLSSVNASGKDEFAFSAYAKDNVWNVLFDDTNTVHAPMPAEPEKGKWNLVTFTVAEDEVTFYLNGTQIGSSMADSLSSRLDSMEDMVNNVIGMTVSKWTDPDAKALIDDVCLYRQVLSKAQIKTMAEGYGLEVKELSISGPGGANELLDGTIVTDTAVSLTHGDVHAKLVENKENGTFYFSAAKKDQVVLDASAIGIVTEDELSSNLELIEDSIVTKEGKDEYELTTGNTRTISDSYQEVSFTLKNKTTGKELTIIARAYENGFAYRYVLQGEAGTTATIKKETSEYVLPAAATMWAGYDNAGNYECDYNKINVSQLKDRTGKYTAPIIVNDGDMWMLCAEAAVFSDDNPYCASHLETKSGSRSLAYTFGKGTEGDVTMTYKEDGTIHTPWRAMAMSDDVNDIINSSLFTSLNPAADETLFADYKSWVKTGTTAWSWWSEAGDDPIEYDQQKDYIDFAAENGWGYVCLDFGWCLWKDYKTKVKELVDYGAQKGVGIMLWYGVNNDNHGYLKDSEGKPAYPTYSLLTTEQMVEQFEWCQSIGVKAVKVDYYENDDQKTMKQMNDCATIAAKNKLCVLFHGCSAPKGEQRTYPNVLGYEAVKGSEFYKWNCGPSVYNCLTYIFGRNVLGGMDFTPVAAQVDQIKATVGFQLAQVVAYQSGFTNIASSIYKLEGFKGLSLINRVPTQWDEATLLEGYPGTHQTIARRSGENWFLASMSSKARTVDASLDFLGDDTYYAYIYKDNETGKDIKIETQTVTKDSTLSLNLLANGGAAVMFTKTEQSLGSRYDDYTYYEAEEEVNQLTGTAEVGKNQFASGMKQITKLGGKDKASNLTFPAITVEEDGVYEMRLYYTCKTNRRICYRVNGGETIRTDNMNSGVNTLAAKNVYVTLKKGNNVIDFGNNDSSAPDLDRIAISQKTVSMQPTVSDGVPTPLDPSATGSSSSPSPTPTPTQTATPTPTQTPTPIPSQTTQQPGTDPTRKYYQVTMITGIGSPNIIQVSKGEKVQPLSGSMQRRGYEFLGWYNGTAKYDINALVESDLVLKASWKKISLPKAKIAKKKKKGKKITVTIKKVKGAIGYQMKAGSNKKVTKNKKTVTGKRTKLTLKKWKKKKCYIKVRVYKIDSAGKKVYGKWSKVKRV